MTPANGKVDFGNERAVGYAFIGGTLRIHLLLTDAFINFLFRGPTVVNLHDV